MLRLAPHRNRYQLGGIGIHACLDSVVPDRSRNCGGGTTIKNEVDVSLTGRHSMGRDGGSCMPFLGYNFLASTSVTDMLWRKQSNTHCRSRSRCCPLQSVPIVSGYPTACLGYSSSHMPAYRYQNNCAGYCELSSSSMPFPFESDGKEPFMYQAVVEG